MAATGSRCGARRSLARGADPNRLLDGVTAFHLAVGIDSLSLSEKLTRLMLHYGADPNIRSSEGSTPLHIACAYGRYDVVSMLLDSGGDPTLKDQDGMTALQDAEDSGCDLCKALVLQCLEDRRRAQSSLNKTPCGEQSELEVQPHSSSSSDFSDHFDTCLEESTLPFSPRRASPECSPPDEPRSPIKHTCETNTSPGQSPVTPHTPEEFLDQSDEDLLTFGPVMTMRGVGLLGRGLGKTVEDVSDELGHNLARIQISQQSTLVPSVEEMPSCNSSSEKTDSYFGEGRIAGFSGLGEESLLSTDEDCSLRTVSDRYAVRATYTRPKSGPKSTNDPWVGAAKNAVKSQPRKFVTNVHNELNSAKSWGKSSDQTKNTKRLADSSKTNAGKSWEKSGDHSKAPKRLGNVNLTRGSKSWETSDDKLKTSNRLPDLNLAKDSKSWETSDDKLKTPTRLADANMTNLGFNSTGGSPSTHYAVAKWLGMEAGPEQCPEEPRCPSVASYKTTSTSSTLRTCLTSHTQTTVHTEKKTGFAVQETCLIPNPNMADCTAVSCCSSQKNPAQLHDWKDRLDTNQLLDVSTSSFNTSRSTYFSGFSSTSVVVIPPHVRQMSTGQLRAALEKEGEIAGPITSSTRSVYETRLVKIRDNPLLVRQKKASKSSDLPPEIGRILSGDLDLSSQFLQELDSDLTDAFSAPDPRHDWREGTRKVCFNYLLLDPRVTQNLPCRSRKLPHLEGFSVFLRAIFYVGKGTRSRPYAHFKEATAQLNSNNTQLSEKIAQIHDIWREGYGVVSLHLFQNVMPVEAYTREACMIDAVGLDRITNKCRGKYYGPTAQYPRRQTRLLGLRFLFKAYNILLHEGERQIRPIDIV